MCFLAAFLSVSVLAQAQEKIRIGISSSSPGFLPTVVAEQKGLPNTGWRQSIFEFPCR
jgi:hypothetical protein